MHRKIKSIFFHPFAAPLAKPLQNIWTCTVEPVRGFGAATKALARTLSGPKKPELYDVVTGLQDAGGVSGVLIAMTGTIAGLVLAGTVAMAMTSVLMTAGLGGATQVAAVAAAGISGAALGAVVGPFVVAGVVAAAGFVVGCTLGAPAGLVQGSRAAYNHLLKPQLQAATPAAVLAQEEQKNPLTEKEGIKNHIEAVFGGLSADEQREVLARLHRKAVDSFSAAADKPVRIMRPVKVGKPAADISARDMATRL